MALSHPFDQLQLLNPETPDDSVGIPLQKTGRARTVKLFALATVAAGAVLLGGVAVWVWGYGVRRDNPGFWHLSLVSLLFWLSVSQGTVALSCLLRIAHASSRYPLSRLLDMASLFGVWAPALLPFLIQARRHIYALGASAYSDNVWRVAGPGLWDAVAIGTAFVAGWMLLWLTAMPDLAVLRDRSRDSTGLGRLYRWLAGPWHGSARQWKVLRQAEGVLVVGCVIAFVASQTLMGWDYQLAAAHAWDSSIFAPLYTVGSLLGGTAMAVLLSWVAGRLLGTERFSDRTYESLGRLMIALGLIWFYFRWCDYLTAWYEHIPAEWELQTSRITSFPFWAGLMTFCCFVLPVFGCLFKKIRSSRGALASISVLVLAGLLIQRFLDTVPTFAPNYPISALTPTVSSAIAFLGLCAMFVLTYLIAARFIPVISGWGTAKQRTRSSETRYGNAVVTVMVEDPPIWET